MISGFAWVRIYHPDRRLWGRQVAQSEALETLLWFVSPANRETQRLAHEYYLSQRPLILESARNFEALEYWTEDVRPSTMYLYWYDLISLRFDAMLKRYRADARADDFRIEKDKCEMYRFLEHNRLPIGRLYRRWENLGGPMGKGSLRDAGAVAKSILASLQGAEHRHATNSTVRYPAFFKCCHLTQGHAHSTHMVKSESALGSTHGWMTEKLAFRATDWERPWAAAHDTLTDTLRPGIILQAASHFDIELKVVVVWGRAYLAFENGKEDLFFRDGSTRQYRGDSAYGVHAAKATHRSTHWLFTEGHLDRVWHLSEGLALLMGIDQVRFDIFVDRKRHRITVNENSLSSACNPVFRTECKFLSWAWAEPLVTRAFRTYRTPLRTYELRLDDLAHPPPNSERARAALAEFQL